MKLDSKKTVKYSLRAPESLAERMSGNDRRQVIRSKFMRDRDRILYSKAFRRLAGKTQVFLSGVDDHKRTRLTHTLEVSQIARTISHNLNLDDNLTEAIALGHDIGHTPYGHAGERILHEIMTQHTNHPISNCPLNSGHNNKYDALLGFKHNLQSAKIAMKSERNYGEYGLDLTNFTLFGLRFHSRTTYKEGKIINPELLDYYSQFLKAYGINGDVKNEAWSFEAFVVREADEIAQRHHDLEDAIRGNLITKSDVCEIINSCFKDYLQPSDRKTIKSMKSKDDESFITDMSRIIVNLLVGRLVKCSVYNMNFLIENEKLNSKTFPQFIITHNPKTDNVAKIIEYEKIGSPDNFKNKLNEFQDSISNRVLTSYDIQRADAKGRYIIRKLFQAFYTTPQQLPNHSIIEFMVVNGEYNSYEEVQGLAQKYGMGYIRSQFEKKYELHQNDDIFNVQLMRVICDYISGMTDLYASNMYQQLYS